ncbi:MAG: ABC transporter ATP-binding protein [Acidimicrobiales bacterium]|nr:ABC transporter ATP-binding protein [Acidimicrobiales bacterium]
MAVREATVRFGPTEALSDLSVSVAPGEIVAVVGPSGCGKSTLLRCIAGLQPLDRGSVLWDGVDLAMVPTHRRDIGLMFQDHALFEHRSVRDNVGFGLKMRGRKAAERDRRIDELLELVGLGGFGNRAIPSLSGGEAQRVALARALAPSPRVLLLDEPLGSLDRARREHLVGEIRSVLREVGQTALHVTHDQDEAFAVADRIAVMRSGTIERIGTPERVWHDPGTAFVAEFLGHNVISTPEGPAAVPADAYRLVPTNGLEPGPPAVVFDVRFRGDHTVVTVDTAEGERVRLRTGEPTSLRPGDAVGVEIDPERVTPLGEDPNPA